MVLLVASAVCVGNERAGDEGCGVGGWGTFVGDLGYKS